MLRRTPAHFGGINAIAHTFHMASPVFTAEKGLMRERHGSVVVRGKTYFSLAFRSLVISDDCGMGEFVEVEGDPSSNGRR